MPEQPVRKERKKRKPPILTERTQRLLSALQERLGIPVQVDKDWHYGKEERRWVPMNDQSGWYLCIRQGRAWRPERFFIR